MNRHHVPMMPPNEQTVPFPDNSGADISAEQYAEIEADERRRLENEEMEKHFRQHPHG